MSWKLQIYENSVTEVKLKKKRVRGIYKGLSENQVVLTRMDWRNLQMIFRLLLNNVKIDLLVDLIEDN